MSIKYYWIPELILRPGLYARSVVNGELSVLTRDSAEAMRFDSRDDCAKWCEHESHRWTPKHRPVFSKDESP